MKVVLENVSVVYDEGLPSETTALTDVNLAVSEGECVAVIGPTGSGKTTLLEIAAGLTRPTRGTAVLAPATGGRLRDFVGLAYQFPESQFFEETVLLDVAFGPERQGLDETAVRDRVRDALERSGLDADLFGDRAPLTLSAGEKRRVAVAGILALARPFLMLDEPTAGLDPAASAALVDLVKNETHAGRGVVVVTHDLGFVERVASRTVILSEGRVLADRDTVAAFADGDLLEGLGLAPPPRYALTHRLRKRAPGLAERVEQALKH